MEKNLNKYVTLEEAAKGNYITAQMISALAQNNRLPYFCDKGTIMVYPGDVTNVMNELINGLVGDEYFVSKESKKKKNTKTMIPETVPQAPEPEPDIGEQPIS